MYAHFNYSRIDTTPGVVSPFAPPAKFSGNYRNFMRQRWKTDQEVRQMVAVLASWLACGSLEITFSGPYADEARQVALSSLKKAK